MASVIDPTKASCSLLIFLATPAEEAGLVAAAQARDIPFERIKRSPLGEYLWFGLVGGEELIAICPSKEKGMVVMGSHGRLGTAAKGIRLQELTGGQGIVQVGMAFGVDPRTQSLGDVLVSTSLIPSDNRPVRHDPSHPAGYRVDHGAARVHSAAYRDELVRGVPTAHGPIVGGAMEGVGLLAASTATDNPAWCVVKGISDFADEHRDSVVAEHRPMACRNAAELVLAALHDGRIRRQSNS